MSGWKLPEGWVVTNLQNIANWGSGGTPSRSHDEYYNGNIPWIKTGDLGPKLITEASEYITDAGVKNSSAKYFPKGSVAIAMYGATIGKTSILGIDATTNQACAVGSPIEGITSSIFLYYFLLNEKNAFIKKGKGGAQPNISQAVIKEHPLSLPPYAEQKIIAEKLDTLLAQVDNTKARLEQIPQILKRFRQAALAAVVNGKSVNTNIDENTLTTLGNIAKNIKYGTSKKCSETQGSTAVLRIPNIGPGYIINSDLKYADFDQKELVTLTLKEGDLLLIRSNGSVDLVGKVAVISENDTEYLYAGYLIRVRLDKERAAPKYISYCLQSPQLRQVIENIARSTSGVNNINSKELASLEIPLPPLPEQHEIVRRVEQLFAWADTIEKQVNNALNRVNSLTQSILAKAFRGELTAQWRAENPDLISGENSAAALLEKIKAERAASGGKKNSRKKS
ncbi:TPA: 4'-phosphopantetheinyl transferase [Klebsiella quasipneumoniae subsp. similipneumoniae]|uniref:restriction endonuclease subunit S n=1 Tax=Klebsiella quasipneumoniae TaxID=1463165 RepID=UPI000D3CC88F|nr:restriction endonuclease subunit S [Klebsiella quasipneumoniae]HCI6800434.1 restriction endonuclease subunit S [Klebsiella quasipneumoniae subsp. quasipneumoniae]MDE4836990.1 restriction endonuclease subunit S [Klebsiella quasipneumoniae subsp. similipneumoniae]PUG97259.1 4'-phosphopantetheinyl transferase [Klebsiella quasipneumoniae]VAO27460.1 type I restriction-modification system [Klebsiella quasipneumoniae]HBT4757113.1 4'-phosphopantetheinyl transferase [Klebsiella quasipneumoniae subsp